MDELAEFNRRRWNELSREGVDFGRPWLDLTLEEAHKRVDPEGIMSRVSGKRVLLLAGGGGQQSAAFGLLGAEVTVLDLSEEQLAADRKAADHYGLDPTLVQGDMRDLSRFDENAFDLVWHAHSIGFVPDVRVVFRAVARVLRDDGLYRLSCGNPFTIQADESSWTGEGYVIKAEYSDSEEVEVEPWEIEGLNGSLKRVVGPREFLHVLSTLINVPIGLGFRLLGAWEDEVGDIHAPPGSWSHFTAVCPQYLVFWWQLSSKE
jgi:ubiquinone/menaquinone biosynthesis C-methylase UbiE